MSSAMKTATGSVVKQVVCETCGHKYEYTLNRTALGKYSGSGDQATAEKAAEEDAARQLQKELETGCEIKPCPECGAITREMRKRRAAFLPQMLAVMGLGLALAGGVYVVGKITGRNYFVAGGLGLLIFLAGLIVFLLRAKEMFTAGKERKGIRKRG